jgi:hypothetical protein
VLVNRLLKPHANLVVNRPDVHLPNNNVWSSPKVSIKAPTISLELAYAKHLLNSETFYKIFLFLRLKGGKCPPIARIIKNKNLVAHKCKIHRESNRQLESPTCDWLNLHLFMLSSLSHLVGGTCTTIILALRDFPSMTTCWNGWVVVQSPMLSLPTKVTLHDSIRLILT